MDAAFRMARGFQEAFARQQSEYRKSLPMLRASEETQSRIRLNTLADLDRQRFLAEDDSAKRKHARNVGLGVLVGAGAILFMILVFIVFLRDALP
jgi:hypothetical protein